MDEGFLDVFGWEGAKLVFVTEGISRCWGPSVDKFHVLRDDCF